MGNLDAQRDWGYTPDYVHAMWLMLQQEQPADFVVATGRTHSVRRFAELAFQAVGLDYREYVHQDEQLMRPADVDLLVGDASKAKVIMGWEPVTGFEKLVEIMVTSELQANRQ